MAIQLIFIRMARPVVQNVISQMLKQRRIVEDQAFNPMRAMVQTVVGGVWRGAGANAFVEEVSSLMIPGVGQVMEHISQTTSNIQHAAKVMDRADEEVSQLVSSRLIDTFRFY